MSLLRFSGHSFRNTVNNLWSFQLKLQILLLHVKWVYHVWIEILKSKIFFKLYMYIFFWKMCLYQMLGIIWCICIILHHSIRTMLQGHYYNHFIEERNRLRRVKYLPKWQNWNWIRFVWEHHSFAFTVFAWENWSEQASVFTKKKKKVIALQGTCYSHSPDLGCRVMPDSKRNCLPFLLTLLNVRFLLNFSFDSACFRKRRWGL